MKTEVATLLWLQWKLTAALFRTRRASAWARLGRLLLVLVMLLMLVPFCAFMGAGLAYLGATLSAQAALQLMLIVNACLLGLWLVLPTMYSTDLVERLDLPRLFAQPVSLRGLTVGSALVALLNPLGLGTLLVLLGEAAALAWHAPLALPLIVAGTALTLVLFVLAGRLMEDLFDLVAGDRRLRGLMMFLLLLPLFLVIIATQFLPVLVQPGAGGNEWLRGVLSDVLPAGQGLSFVQVLDGLLLHFRPAQVLLWLPMGPGTAAMALPAAGQWGLALLALAAGAVLCALLAWVHGRILERMLQGTALHTSSERVNSRGLAPDWPGPSAWWAIIGKDWTYMRRSPLTRQVLVATPFIVIIFSILVWRLSIGLPRGSALAAALPFLAVGVLLVSVNLAMMNFSANYYGAVDREGFAGLMLAPVDRHWLLLSQGLVTLVLTLALTLPLLVLAAILFGVWALVPWGLLATVCLHYSTLPAYELVGMVSPFRAQMALNNKNQGNLWMVLAWCFASLPVLALALLPWVWSPAAAAAGLALAGLALAVLYSAVLYVFTLRPLAGFLDRRTFQILEVVTREE
jgi:hypothetical protein